MKSFALQLPLVLFVLTAPTAFGASPGKPAQKKLQSSCPAGATCGDSRDVWSIGAAGPENAPVTVLIFSDFQSFLCGRAAHVLVDVFGESGDVRLIFKHVPSTKSDGSILAHEAAIAAGAQGKFWEMHNLLFDNQTKLTRTDLSNYARQLGLNFAVFDAALNSHTYRSMIDRDLAEAKGLGVTMTPTFFINGRRLV
jgi:protein-disulfide isomerase